MTSDIVPMVGPGRKRNRQTNVPNCRYIRHSGHRYLLHLTIGRGDKDAGRHCFRDTPGTRRRRYAASLGYPPTSRSSGPSVRSAVSCEKHTCANIPEARAATSTWEQHGNKNFRALATRRSPLRRIISQVNIRTDLSLIGRQLSLIMMKWQNPRHVM